MFYSIVCAESLSRVRLFVTPWTVAQQVSLSMGILQARILVWLPCTPPEDLPIPGIEPRSPALQADSLPTEAPVKPIESLTDILYTYSSVFLRVDHQFSSVQFSPVTQSCPPLCDPVNRNTPGLPIHHQFLEFTQTCSSSQ